MKLLRVLYMVLASITLLPLIALFEAFYLGWFTYHYAKEGRPEKGLSVWLGAMKAGIDMNTDFMDNGL